VPSKISKASAPTESAWPAGDLDSSVACTGRRGPVVKIVGYPVAQPLRRPSLSSRSASVTISATLPTRQGRSA
jgi:hypothetical protein